MKTAAGITVCLGALAAGQSQGSEIQTTKTSDVQPVAFNPAIADGIIMDHYVELSAGYLPGSLYSSLDRFDMDDPAWDVLNSFKNNTLPQSITDRCELVLKAINTEHPSLSLSALLWRVVNEPFFETEGFSDNEMEVLYSTLDVLHRKAWQWRWEIFENRLDPYIRDGRLTDPPFFMYSKAGPRPGDVERHYLAADLNSERWGTAEDTPGVTAEYLLEHPYAEQMNLVFRSPSSVEISEYSGSDRESLNTDSSGMYTIGIFDVIESNEDAVFLFEISSMTGSEIPYGYESQSDYEFGENHVSTVIEVSIVGGRRYTYIELLRSAYLQRRSRILSIAFHMLSEVFMYDRYNTDNLPGDIIENEALLWPAVREIAGSGTDISHFADWFIDIEELRGRALKKDIDFWMF